VVDLSRPFKPFGERPRYGDALHLMIARTLAPDLNEITVKLALKPVDLAKFFADFKTSVEITTSVQWQYLRQDGTWQALTLFTHKLTVSAISAPPTITRVITRDGAVTSSEDGSFWGPTATGAPREVAFTFAPPADAGIAKVAGQAGLWIRALLKNDDAFGRDSFIAQATPLTVVPATLIAPVVEAVALTTTFKPELRDVGNIVSSNDFRVIDHAAGPGPRFPLRPFVAPADLALPGSDTPALGAEPALYLGFDRAFADVFISLYFKLRETFPSVETPAEQGQPLVSWEYLAAGSRWRPLDVEDDTRHLTTSGCLGFIGPSDSIRLVLFDADPMPARRDLFWYRARLVSGRYDHPPALLGIFPNTVLADNRYSFRAEVVVGSGSGVANQRVILIKTPVLAGELWVREPEPPPETEVIALAAEIGAGPVLDVRSAAAGTQPAVTQTQAQAQTPARQAWVRWRRVPNFFGSGPRSRHFTLNPTSGELRFGNGQEGMLPPVARDNLVLRDYRSGGGTAAARAGGPLAVKELKSSLPYVEKVFNVEAATGGSDPWSLDEIFAFGPQLIKNQGRAVSAEDFEWMVLEAFTQLARAKCLSTKAPGPRGLVNRPGAVTIIVVPRTSERKPQPTSALLRQIADFLGAQTLGTIVSDLHVLGPGFTEVTVRARVRASDPRESGEVERRAQRALEDFFHPLTGGESGRGWDFGRDVPLSEVFAVLQRVPGVDHVASAEFDGAPAGTTALTVDDNNLVASGGHLIEMV
jgi:hypothetical protein